VATDRISAFDCILPTPIPGKGEVLTSVSEFWLEKLKDVVPNQKTQIQLSDVLQESDELSQLEGRAAVVRKFKALPIEAVVRGYLVGSGWKDYQRTGRVCGLSLPEGLQLAEQLPEVLYTPSTKAELGTHDENISFDQTVALVGAKLATEVRDVSIKLYQEASEFAKARGIIIADTKFEFGIDDEGKLHLIDEVLTPDSSRFWPVDGYAIGRNPASFDKQFVRDYLETLDWDKQPPAPALPESIIQKTAEKYQEAKTRITS
jgi:phosphoribosylaminoimidazole-succinocarboxamide synthase